MGHHTIDPSPLAVHRTLRLHPNFEMPPVPEAPKRFDDVAEFIFEAVARYVSPPKLEGEDDEFECIDVATAIREHLRPEIMRRLNLPTRRTPVKS